ncbi:MAG: peptidase sortase [Frankiales bacterium]|nr:peptidase sortase [Frankiales bacterium]
MLRPRLSAWVLSAALAVTGSIVLLHDGSRDQRPAEPALTSGPWTASAPVPTPPRPVARVVAAIPVRLRIPAIGVDTALVSLGQTPDGEVATPTVGPDYDRAGWYRYSPTPGSTGPSIIVGHVDSARAGPSVFYRLRSLHVNDQVFVTGTDHAVITFQVTRLLRVSKQTFPTQLVYGNTTDAALRLITCGGGFNRRTGHYDDNLVVLATRTT